MEPLLRTAHDKTCLLQQPNGIFWNAKATRCKIENYLLRSENYLAVEMKLRMDYVIMKKGLYYMVTIYDHHTTPRINIETI